MMNLFQVSLASGCWDKGTVIHEVLHSLGFWHEQSRPDRDSYVRILTQNIIQGNICLNSFLIKRNFYFLISYFW